MQQVPQDTAQQILASRQQYQSAIASVSSPLTYNISQLSAAGLAGGQAMQQQQRAGAEIQRQQALQQLQTQSAEFEKSAQIAQQQLAAQQAAAAALLKKHLIGL